MTAAFDTALPPSVTTMNRPVLAPAVAAVSVALLVAGTLCTVGAVIVGASLHLLGIPDDWALAAAVLTAIAGLVPTAALTRRTWRVERHGPDA